MPYLVGLCFALVVLNIHSWVPGPRGLVDGVAGRKGIKCTLRIKPKTSPISEDSALVGKALSEQPDILAINRKYTYDQLKDVLQKWLNPEEETTTESTPTVAATDDEDDFLKDINAPIQPYSLDVKPKETATDIEVEEPAAEA